MGINLDFSNVKDGFALLEPGIYLATVTKIVSGTSKAGNPMLTWDFKFSDPSITKGARFWTSLSQGALWKLKSVLINAFDVAPETLETTDFSFEPDDYIGMEVGLVIEHTEYEGKEIDSVADIVSADEAQALISGVDADDFL